jgi:hypothetical protein
VFRCDALVGAGDRPDVSHGIGDERRAARRSRDRWPAAPTPNIPNAVPGHVELMMEVRRDSDAVLDQFPERLIVSLAGDGVYVASTGPIGMIFIPCAIRRR